MFIRHFIAVIKAISEDVILLNMLFLFVLFFCVSIIHIFLAYFPISFIPELEFPYADLLRKYYDPSFLHPFARFDSVQYLSIARNGYGEFQQGYFPLFPLLISLLSPLFMKSYLAAGVFISFASFFLGLYYFQKYISLLLPEKKQVTWSLVFLVAFPTAFFYQVIYPTSLLLFASSAAFYYLTAKKYVRASLFALVTSLTGIQGVLLLIPFFLSTFAIQPFRRDILQQIANIRKKITLLPVALSPLYGLIIYSTFLFLIYKDPLYFYHAQEAFGANRSSDQLILLPQVLYRYLKIFFTSDINFQYMIALLEFGLFSLVFCALVYRLWQLIHEKKISIDELGLQLYSLAAIILPTLTGTLTSLPRYILVAFGFFIILARIKSNGIKIFLVTVFSVLQIILFVYFLRGYFIS